MQSKLIDAFIAELPKFGNIFDMGAGNLRWSKRLADRCIGRMVFAIDSKPMPDSQPVIVVNSDMRNIAFTRDVGGVLFKNSLQFIPREDAFALIQKIPLGTTVAIETFYKAPEPEFKIKSTYRVSDFQEYGKILWSEETEETANGLDEVQRTFYLTRLVFRREQNLDTEKEA